jgi:hypothetical protein
MRMTASKRRSSFGTICVRCDIELIAPERSEYRDDGQIRHFWHCSTCDYSFEVIPYTYTHTRRRDAFSLRLVA